MSWTISRFEREFLRQPGEHMLEIGQTGRGKTQGLYYVLDGLIAKSPQDTVVWIDTGKTSELLTLARFRPVNLLIPEGCDVSIKEKGDMKISDQISKTYICGFEDAWRNLTPRAINVISISRFIRRHAPYSRAVASLFQALIDYAYDYRLPLPLDVFVDEFQFVAPSKSIAYNSDHLKAGKDVASALFTLRSLRVRIIAATQSWNVINPPARNSFQWLFLRGGSYLPSHEQPKLSRYNELWEKCEREAGYIVYPDRVFSDKVYLPFYGDGKDYGSVLYYGRLDKPKKEKNDENSGP